MGYRLMAFFKDILPFAFTAAVVMVVTGFVTLSIENLWLLLLSRVVIAAVLYYGVMRIAGAVILKECLAFIKGKIVKGGNT